jgi:asparagine synthase (glutamine-hydrolysing)
MCGIAGIVSLKADIPRVEQMLEALTHRGPDDCGIWSDPSGCAVLGHRRLSIIDLSSLGHQPMSYGSGRYWITYNGEVYNYREVRRELEKEACTFFSQTDTEVVLAAYARWGPACVKQFRGMFSFAIWDREERTLFLARDRMGIKPLLYWQKDGYFLFASELKGLLASKAIDATLNLEALFDYLATGSVIQPRSFIRDVHFLEAGSSLLMRSNGHSEITRYWDLKDVAASLRQPYSSMPYGELVAWTREKLEEACQLHLVADVPVGSFLSGGIDSTAVTALMARYAPYPIKSFTLGFAEQGEFADELSYARMAAERIGCDHTEVVLTGAEVAVKFDRLVEAIDQPSQDGTNTFFVSEAASRALKCTLSGLGGDELFAGYQHFQDLQKAAQQPASLLDRILGAIHALRPNRYTLIAAFRLLPPEWRLAKTRRILEDETVKYALSAKIGRIFQADLFEKTVGQWLRPSASSIGQTSLFECQGYLRNTLLRDNDVMSMANSLEVRPVLLDHELVEHALALPDDVKLRKGVQKAIFKDAIRDLVPPETIGRPKMGFELPLGTWLRGNLKERFCDCVNDRSAREIFSAAFIQRLKRGLGNPRMTRVLWSFFIFWEWFRKNRCRIEV